MDDFYKTKLCYYYYTPGGCRWGDNCRFAHGDEELRQYQYSGRHFLLQCDGSSRGNPGPSGIGYVIYEDNSIVAQVSMTIGYGTNNEAEYRAVIEGLQHCLNEGASTVEVQLDSELVVRQLNGEYQIRNPRLWDLADKVFEQFEEFEYYPTITWIDRQQNHRANALAQRATG
mmetsp:Transcript_22145/g.38039  ORF Transcript_22145/g.38039 Transcript_22145/m.38039 type:complete len:172 (-) Transcript_22145:55-570(-)